MHDPSLHLFVDDHHIRNAFALKRVFNGLTTTHESILQDTEGRYIGWGTVLRQPDGKYRMWYQSVARFRGHDMALAGVWGRGSELGFFPDRAEGAIPETKTSIIGYAESDDAQKWNKPKLGLVEWRGSKDNNLVLDGTQASTQFKGNVTNMDCVTVLRDDADSDPAKRYKMINHWETIHCWDNDISKLDRPKEMMERWWQHRAKYLTTSPDGIHWSAPMVRIKDCEGGDYCGIIRDERNGHWWFNDRPTGGMPVGYIRLAALTESPDLYHWPPHLEQVLHPGEFEDYGKRYEHHGFTPFNYGDQDLGVLELSIIGQPVMGLLVSHRDGERWKVVSYDVPFLRVGPKGADDDSIAVITRNPPLVIEDRLRFIYNGRRNTEKYEDRFGGMFAGEMRLDGFAGMTVDTFAVQRLKSTGAAPTNLPAVLQTNLLSVTQPELQINIAGHHGSAKVAVLGDGARPLPGFELDNCLPVDEDDVRAPVKWKDHADLRDLQKQRVSVMVVLGSGTIYSVRL